MRTYSAKGPDVEHSIETRASHVTGKASVKIRSGSGHDTSIYTNVKLNSGTTYALSAWIKLEGVNGGHGALLNVHELQHKGKTTAVKGNSDWKKSWRAPSPARSRSTASLAAGARPRAPHGTTTSPCRRSN